MPGPSTSPRFRLDGTDIQKIVIGAMIAIAGTLLGYLSTEVLPILEESKAWWAPTTAAIAMILINTARKWLADNKPDG